MSWQFQADQPIYTQLVARLQQQIVSGVYPPGSKLPSVRELAADAGVNPNTVQRAFADLERAGLIYTQRTAGKFVTEDAAAVAAARRSLAEAQTRQYLAAMRALAGVRFPQNCLAAQCGKSPCAKELLLHGRGTGKPAGRDTVLE